MTAEYLITLRRIKKEQEEKRQSYDKNDINDQSPEGADLLSLKSFCRTTTQKSETPLTKAFSTLESRCPDYVPMDRWQQAVEDGRRFLAIWGNTAEGLGWTPQEIFGLHTPPDNPHPSYSRLSRHDCTGLVWMLDGRTVIALSSETASIKARSGSVLSFCRVTT